MARIPESEVRKLLSVGADRDIGIHIETANLIVEEDIVPSGIALTDERLRLIELYLAAHFTAVAEEKGGLERHTKGSATEVYRGGWGQGLKMTRFGQHAIILDSSGTLAKAATPIKRAEFRVV